jgi:hypothetical protein
MRGPLREANMTGLILFAIAGFLCVQHIVFALPGRTTSHAARVVDFDVDSSRRARHYNVVFAVQGEGRKSVESHELYDDTVVGDRAKVDLRGGRIQHVSFHDRDYETEDGSRLHQALFALIAGLMAIGGLIYAFKRGGARTAAARST